MSNTDFPISFFPTAEFLSRRESTLALVHTSKMAATSASPGQRRAPFRDARDFVSRLKLSGDLREQYPHCLPVIVERASTETTLPMIDKRQFLVPATMTVGNFLCIVRERLGLPSRTSLWLYVGRHALSSHSSPMIESYTNYCDPDGFLYLQYRGEDAFGSLELPATAPSATGELLGAPHPPHAAQDHASVPV